MKKQLLTGVILSISALLLIGMILILCIFHGCFQRKLNAEDYVSYLCYDKNFVCLATGKDSTKTDQSLLYRTVKGESNDQFICVSDKGFTLGAQSYAHLVFQNPQNTPDIWAEWTVQKVELYHGQIQIRPGKDHYSEPKDSTSDTAVLMGTKEWYLSSGNNVDLQEFRNIESSDQYTRMTQYIRVYFNESEHIAWDACVDMYYSKETEEYYVYIWKWDGALALQDHVAKNDLVSKNPIKVELSNALHAWLLACIGITV